MKSTKKKIRSKKERDIPLKVLSGKLIESRLTNKYLLKVLDVLTDRLGKLSTHAKIDKNDINSLHKYLISITDQFTVKKPSSYNSIHNARYFK